MSEEIQKKSSNFSSFPEEILHKIFQHLEKDVRTLYSCIRVNRFLCKFSVPYLWSNPMPNTYSLIRIEIFIYYFEEEDKNLLKRHYELDIFNKEKPYQPLFNYIRYLKILDLRGVRRTVFYWLKDYYTQKYPYSDIYVDFKNSQSIGFIEKSLLKLILKNSSRIEKLILDLAKKYQDIPDYNVFLLNQQENPGIRKIKKLTILNSSLKQFNNIPKFLEILPTICMNIEKIKLFDSFFFDPNLLCNVIEQQKHLTSINITHNFVNIPSALKFHSDSLKKLVFKYVNIYYTDEMSLYALEQLKNLDYLEIDECYPIGAILEPLVKAKLKLETLIINDNEGEYELIESIIKSSELTLKQLISNIYIDVIENKSPLSKICPNITYLELQVNKGMFFDDGYQVKKQLGLFNYIDNLKNLKFFHIGFFYNYNMLGEFEKINLPSLQFISLTDQYYSLDSLKKRVNYFSKIFNKITFYVDNELEINHMNLSLENFAEEKKENGFSLVYTLEGFYSFVATNRILS